MAKSGWIVWVLVTLTLSDSQALMNPLMGEYTDVIFAVHEPEGMEPADLQIIKLFIKSMVEGYLDQLIDKPPDTVRFSLFTFSNTVEDEFVASQGMNLQNRNALMGEVDHTHFHPSARSNLVGAIRRIIRIIREESGPSRTEVVIIITNGDSDVNPEQLDDMCHELRQNYTTVFSIDVGPPGSKRDATAINNINTLTNGNSDYQIMVSDYRSLLTQLEAIMRQIWVHTFQKVCEITTSPCSKLCGIGFMAVHSECNVYVGDPSMLLSYSVVDYPTHCCLLPCTGRHQSPAHTTWFCRWLPPYNGLQI